MPAMVRGSSATPGRYDGRGNGHYARYAPRYVVSGRYCDDYRHYRDVHYHVSPRDYYRDDYPRDAYWLHGPAAVSMRHWS